MNDASAPPTGDVLHADAEMQASHLLDKSVDGDPIRVIPNEYTRAIGGHARRDRVDSPNSPRRVCEQAHVRQQLLLRSHPRSRGQKAFSPSSIMHLTCQATQEHTRSSRISLDLERDRDGAASKVGRGDGLEGDADVGGLAAIVDPACQTLRLEGCVVHRRGGALGDGRTKEEELALSLGMHSRNQMPGTPGTSATH
jgi:hypothetical protein